MQESRRKVSIVTRIFSVFLLITAIDLSAIYVFTGSGQIDQISRNGQLVAENAALRLAVALRSSHTAGPDIDKLGAGISQNSPYTLENCRVVTADGNDAALKGAVSAPALKALRLFESEARLFYVDLAMAKFAAEIYLPLLRSGKLQAVACSVPLASLREAFERLIRISIIIFVVTLLLQAGLAFFIYHVFIARLRSLQVVSQKIGTGDFSGQFTPARRPDELDLLAQSFNSMRVSLGEKTRVLEDTLLSLEKANFDLEGDLILGQEIQQSILPPKSAGSCIRWSVTYRPASRVSGDLYDVIDLPGGRTAILQFDASGHGVPAALLTMMAKISFVEALQRYADPAEVLEAVNRELSDHLQQTGNFLTVFLAVLTDSGSMRWCSAAHTSVIHAAPSRTEVQSLDPTSLSVGFAPIDSGQFHSQTLQLQPGDVVLAYTDGLSESLTHEGVQYGHERIAAIARQGLHGGESAVHAALLTDWNAQVAPNAVEDDVTVFTFSLR